MSNNPPLDSAPDTALSGLYLTEKEIAARVGVGIDKWRAIAKTLEISGLPKRDPLFAGMRYWPKVRQFLDRWNKMDAILPPPHRAAKENWDEYHKRRARPETPAAQGR